MHRLIVSQNQNRRSRSSPIDMTSIPGIEVKFRTEGRKGLKGKCFSGVDEEGHYLFSLPLLTINRYLQGIQRSSGPIRLLPNMVCSNERS